jgi:hypothetical protein
LVGVVATGSSFLFAGIVRGIVGLNCGVGFKDELRDGGENAAGHLI